MSDEALAALLRRAVYEGVRDAIKDEPSCRGWSKEFINHLVDNIVARVQRAIENIPTTYIYALLDPDTKEIRYIGKANDPENRLAQHVYHCWYEVGTPSTDTPKEAWIRSLRQQNKQPDMEILEEVPRAQSWRWERKWIEWARAQGFNITNVARPS